MKYDRINTIFPLQKKTEFRSFFPFRFSFPLEADANPFQKRKTERQDGRVYNNSLYIQRHILQLPNVLF